MAGWGEHPFELLELVHDGAAVVKPAMKRVINECSAHYV